MNNTKLSVLVFIASSLFTLISCSSVELEKEFLQHQKEQTFFGQQNTTVKLVTVPSQPSYPAIEKHFREYLLHPLSQRSYYSRKKEHLTQYELEVEEEVDLEKVLALVRYRNPKILSQEQMYLATLERYSQATDLSNTLAQYESFTREIGQFEPLTEAHPLPGILTLKAEVIHQEREMAFTLWQQTIRDQLAQTKESYANLYYLDRAIDVMQQIIQLLRLSENTVREKYRAGETAQVELLKVQIEIFELQNELITLTQERHTKKIELNLLMDFSPEKKIGKTTTLNLPELSQSLSTFISISLKYQQEIQTLLFQKKKMETMIAMAERMTFPAMSSDQSRFETRPPRQKEKQDLSSGMNEPDTFYGTSNAFIRETKTELLGINEQIREAENQAKRALAEIFFTLDTQKRLQQLYSKELIPQATQSLEVTQTSYLNGKSDFFKVIDALRLLLKFRLQEVRALVDGYKAFSQLEKTLGILFEDVLKNLSEIKPN